MASEERHLRLSSILHIDTPIHTHVQLPYTCAHSLVHMTNQTHTQVYCAQPKSTTLGCFFKLLVEDMTDGLFFQ